MPHSIVSELYENLVLPVIAAPMFIVSGPELVIAQCASGIVGSMPALNARPQSELGPWLTQIETTLTELKRQNPNQKIAPYAINHIIHKSNDRLQADLDVCSQHKVPLIITSLRAPNDVVDTVHRWGGKVFHDVTTLRHAKKALDAGVDGLILVCAGAGGHAGSLSPFALIAEIRKEFNGPIALSGAISRGEDIAAARAMGADFAYIGTRFIASNEARAESAYKQGLVDACANDILNTPFFTGIPANYLRQSIVAAGLDPDNLTESDSQTTNFGSSASVKAWKDIWGAGQGVGSIDNILPVQTIVDQLKHDYLLAYARLNDQFVI